ncbi:hypothetical protein, partial [Escherichia coli]|uniref:hypothetical protein n=1 Tax=Escherichia coli TaxID=562 RepID=UPI00278BF6F0
LQALMTVRPGVEIRSSTDLSLSADWRLPTLSQAQIAMAPRAAEAALTLRAAGDVQLNASLSTGLRASPSGDGTWLGTSDRAGSIRITAGADATA